MTLVITGFSAIVCAFVFVSMCQIVLEDLVSPKKIWNDVLFWLALFGSMVSLGWLIFCAVRTADKLAHFDMDTSSNVFAVVMSAVILFGFNAAMRAVAISKPVRGYWYLAAAALWAAFCIIRDIV